MTHCYDCHLSFVKIYFPVEAGGFPTSKKSPKRHHDVVGEENDVVWKGTNMVGEVGDVV